MRTFARLVTTEFVVTAVVSVTVVTGLVTTVVVFVATTFVPPEVRVFVSATEFVVVNTLVAGRPLTGEPTENTPFEGVVVVVEVEVIVGVESKLLVRMDARLVSVIVVADGLIIATFVPKTVLVTGTVTTLVTLFVTIVVVVFVGAEKPALAFPAATASTAAISALKPFVVAVPLVPKVALVEPRAISPVRTNCTLPLMLAFPLLLLFRNF